MTYAAGGTYNVTLTVTDNAGASASVTKAVTVSAPPPPPSSNALVKGVPVTGLAGNNGTELRYTMAVPAGATDLTFTTSGGTGDADLFVRFGSAPTFYEYDCRSFNAGNDETCGFASARAGTYHVMVRGYRTFDGVSLTGSYSGGVANVPPTANFSFTTSGLSASFTDTSTDSDGTIASRSWSFGDGSTSTATNPSKTYAAANTYSVTLTVTDNAGASAGLTKAVTVTAPPPANTLTRGVPVTGLAGSTGTELRYTMVVPAGATNLTFTIAGSSGDADLYVRFGSAPTTTAYDCRPYLSSSSETCSFAAPQAGTYHVMVRGYTSFTGVTLTGSY
jgi:PKD repeat protein